MASSLKDLLAAVRRTVADNKSLLNDLDSAIGDGDHGTNLARGIEAALADEGKLQGTLPDGLKAVGMALLSKTGGASGPLLGTFFLRMAQTLGVAGSGNDFAKAFAEGIAGIQKLGKSAPNEKTMLDALTPALAALMAQRTAAPAKETLAAMADAAAKGAEATVPMRATKGRASYLGERSVGHMDPGAKSVALVLRALAEAV